MWSLDQIIWHFGAKGPERRQGIQDSRLIRHYQTTFCVGPADRVALVNGYFCVFTTTNGRGRISMFIQRHIQILNRARRISQHQLHFYPQRLFATTRMDVDGSAIRRERSPETMAAIADERPAKKPRIDGPDAKPVVDASTSKSKKKSKFNKRAMQKLVNPEEGTPDDVLWHEVKELLGDSVVEDAVARKADLNAPLKFGDILELDVVEMSSNGMFV